MKDSSSNHLQLLTNIASQTTVFGRSSGQVLDYNQYEDHALGIVATICQNTSRRYLVISGLNNLRNLFSLGVPIDIRANLFLHLNTLVGSLMLSYTRDRKVYSSCFDMMTAFKGQIDETPQSEDALVGLEWEELGKAAYLLTDWEDMMIESISLHVE